MTLLLALLLVPLLAASMSLVVKTQRRLEQVNIAAASVGLLLAALLGWRVIAFGPMTLMGGAVYLDALSVFEMVISALVTGSAQIYACGYLGHEFSEGVISYVRMQRYYGLVNLTFFAFMLICVANNLGVVWIAIEGSTLLTAFLVTFYNKRTAVEAAWKYVMICTVGITLAFMGLILLYYSGSRVLGAGASLHWSSLAASAKQMDPSVLKLAFVFFLIGYGTKVGLAPMHTWLPDAHSEAPSPVSALLSGMLLNGAMYGIIRIHALVVRCIGETFSSHLLMAFGTFSVCLAVPFILSQRDYKRLLAYSSVEHMGIIAVGLGFGGPLGTLGAMLHTFHHSMLKPAMFFSAGNLLLKYRTREILEVRGVLKALPITGTMGLVGAFAIAGAPPFGLFFSEFAVLLAGFQSGNGWVACLVLGAIVLAFMGFASHFGKMCFGPRPTLLARGELGRLTTAPIVGLLVLAAGLGTVVPPALLGALQQIVLVVRGAS